jgi:hypothetical protein
MNENDFNMSHLAGMLCALFLVAAPALIFLNKAITAKQRSLRLANLSLGIGLLSLFFPEAVLSASLSSASPLLHVVGGTIRMGLGVAGLVFGLLALASRTKDGGTGLVKPILGGALSCFLSLMGLSMFLLAFAHRPEAAAASWVYESHENDFRMTLPSSSWTKQPCNDGIVAFVRNRPAMQVIVTSSQQETQEQYEGTLGRLQSVFDQLPGAKLSQENGATPSGATFFYILRTSKNLVSSGDVFSALAVIRSKDRTIILVFEAPIQSLSNMGKQTERKRFDETARQIFLSAERNPRDYD